LAASTPVVYLSLPPGSIPGADSVRIEDVSTDPSLVVTALAWNGGFDPTAVAALVGDTLSVTVFAQGQALGPEAFVVRARRPPAVVRTAPPPGRTDVALNVVGTIVLSQPIDTTTVNSTTVQLLNGTTAVPATRSVLTAEPWTIVIKPVGFLTANTTYTVVLGTGITDQTGDALADPVSFSFTTGQTTSAADSGWSYVAPLPSARGGAAGAILNGQLYVVGGYAGSTTGVTTVQSYDPTANSWTSRAPLPIGRTNAGIGVVNGILYLVGGFGGSNYLNTVEAYDPATDTWTAKAPMPTVRSALAVGVINGVVYAVGGFAPSSPSLITGALEAYDPATDTWTTRSPMPTPREGVSAAVVNGTLYAIGGAYVGTVEAYDPATDTWSTKAPMPTPRAYAAVGVVGGKIYVAGGAGAGGYFSTLEIYDPATDTWTTAAPLPAEVSDLAPGVISGVFYVAGGYNGTAAYFNSVESYAP
jgi:N-acetylneuraminic acid mutarotase